MERTQSQRPLQAPTSMTLPSLIQRSWTRCEKHGGYLHTDPVMLAPGELSDRLLCNASLVQAAQSDVEMLAGIVADAGGIVLLTDASGVILHALGDTGFLHRAEQVALRPGVSWAEDHRGTNAIGSALIEGVPMRVHGTEHYLRRNRILSCHGAPVRSPQGDILGVLDISCDADQSYFHALKLAILFSRQISNHLLAHAAKDYDKLEFHRQESALDSIHRAQILLQDGLIVGANEAAVTLLGTNWRELLNQPLEAWMDSVRPLGDDRPLRLQTAAGTPVIGRLRKKTAPRRYPVWTPAENNTTSDLPHQHKPADTTRPNQNTTATQLPALAPELSPGFERTLAVLNEGLAVLIQGPTGSGKEIYARHLHAKCQRANGPFVAINCGALPESLIEAELFGYAPGAYTGANRQGSIGRLREAHGGVLFLDEIGDMPLTLQTRLLRVLQEREVRPLGADKSYKVDFLLISATNQDLEALVEKGTFRSDLFYRLQDQRVRLNPLSLRQDLPGFLSEEFNRLGGMDKRLTLSATTLHALTAYHWPGNYRELHAVLRTLIIHAPVGGLIQEDDIPAHIRIAHKSKHAQDAGLSNSLHDHSPWRADIACDMTSDLPPTSLRELDVQHMRNMLRRCNGNISEAARRLGIHRSTLHRRLKQFG